MVGLGELAGDVVENGFGDSWVEAMKGGVQVVGKDDLAVVGAFGRVAVGRDVGAVEVVPAGILEPGEGELF